VLVLLVLEAAPVLTNALLPLREVDIASCKNCSSELCLLLDPFESNLHKNCNFGTAASYHGLKVVLSKEFAEQKN